MVKLLLKKDYKENIEKNVKKDLKNPLSLILNLFIMAFLIFIICYIFTLLNKRFLYYEVSDSLFIITIFTLSILELIVNLNKVTKILFNEDDKNIIKVLPVKKTSLIISKIITLFFKELISLSLILIPVSIVYGVINKVNLLFYFLIPVILITACFLVLSLSLILAYPYNFIKELLKGKYKLQFIFVILVITVFAFFYQDILNIFISLVADDRLEYLFNSDNAEKLKIISSFLVPFNFIAGILNQKYLNILFIIIFFILTVFLIYFFSNLLYNAKFKELTFKTKNKVNKLESVNLSLIKKEYNLMFRTSNNFFSYGSLLILLPVFVCIICSTLKPVVLRLTSISLYLPFVLLFVSMFTALVNSFSGLVISREQNNIMILKMIPVSFKKQISLKVGISFFNAGISLFITCIALVLFDVVSLIDGLFIFLITLVLVLTLIMVIVLKDLKNNKVKADTSFNLAVIFSLIIPVIYFIISMILVIFFNKTMMYSLLLILSILILSICLLRFNKVINKSFDELEVE